VADKQYLNGGQPNETPPLAAYYLYTSHQLISLFRLLQQTVEDWAAWHLWHGSPILAACCFLAVDNVQVCYSFFFFSFTFFYNFY
jgi:hypothetical protein